MDFVSKDFISLEFLCIFGCLLKVLLTTNLSSKRYSTHSYFISTRYVEVIATSSTRIPPSMFKIELGMFFIDSHCQNSINKSYNQFHY